MAAPIAIKIRAKKLGVLLRDARLAAGRTMKECAEAIGVTSHRIGTFERGENSPSLPQLEVLTYYLGAPLDHFWGEDSLSNRDQFDHANIAKTLHLRRKIIGAKLRISRKDADVSMVELAREAGVSEGMLRSYERGERPLPLPELEFMLQRLGVSIDEFRDQSGPVGQWFSQEKAIEQFLELPPELQEFVSKPINQPYLELAQRLSEMSVDQLRAVAEGLLDITL